MPADRSGRANVTQHKIKIYLIIKYNAIIFDPPLQECPLRSLTLGIVLSLVLASVALAAEPVRVGVYKSHAWQYKNWGISNIAAMLRGQPGVSIVEVENLKAETLDKLDVLIISTTTKLSPADSVDADRGNHVADWRKSVLNFVQRGGGLYLGYYAAGADGDFSTWNLFPSVVTKTSEKINTSIFHKSAPGHEAVAGTTDQFVHSYDHFSFEKGPKGIELAADKDNQPVILAGQVAGGRVIYSGIPFGLTWGNKDPMNAADVALLGGIVKWLGGGERKAVSMDETTRTLFEEARQYNIAAEIRKAAEYANLPTPKFDESVLWLPMYVIKPGVTMSNKDNVVAVIENAHRMGFSKVMIMAKLGSYFYRTGLKTTEDVLATADFDPVECAVTEARKRGMKVGLIVCPFMARNDFLVYRPDLTKAEAEKLKKGEIQLDQIDADHKWARFNCPDDPEVQKRALAIAAEVMEKFKPDEINLDYIRYKDDYGSSCFCEFSQAQKAEYLKQHPETAAEKVDEAFARQNLTNFVKEFRTVVKKANPDVVLSCYTISAPSFKAPEWVNQYFVDIHAKYVSRQLIGPESKLTDIAPLVKNYTRWASAMNPETQFSPIVASYDRKTPERVETELKIVFNAEVQNQLKLKRVEYFEYAYLLEKGDKHELDLPVAKAISRMLGGTLHQTP
jgi:hypothetical protein